MDTDTITSLVYQKVRLALSGEQSDGCVCNPAAAAHSDIASVIEHSLLNPDTTEKTILKGCSDAVTYGFANVCVTPYLVSVAAQHVAGSKVVISAPVGFPHGAASLLSKCAEIRYCIQCGAKELDLSLNIVAAKSGHWDVVYRELCEMLNVAGNKAVCKAIYEQGLYTDDEKKQVLEIIERSRAPYLKISNALTGKKAAAEDVTFVRKQIGTRIGIKIDGGIKTAQTICELQAAGAQRFGCSASVAIVTGK
ncbi:MAG: deoxyribose-phosphate aldolase [Eubacteriales bacterium]|nr:deoxyribose-phosphate aldolase [Eubacteriales bacterium]